MTDVDPSPFWSITDVVLNDRLLEEESETLSENSRPEIASLSAGIDTTPSRPILPPEPKPWNPGGISFSVYDALEYLARLTEGRKRRQLNVSREKLKCDRLIDRTQVFVHEEGENHVALLTVTPHLNGTFNDTVRAFERFRPYIVKTFGEKWVRVVGISRTGLPHIHVLVQLPFDIKEGFDLDVYHELTELRRRKVQSKADWSKLRSLTRRLSSNAKLKQLWKKLRSDVVRYGFGCRVNLMPICTTGEAVAKYLVRNVNETARVSWKPSGKKSIAYSMTFPKAPPRPLRPAQIAFRQRRDQLIDALGMTMETMRVRYGRSWHCHLCRAMNDHPIEQTAAGRISLGMWARAIEQALERHDQWKDDPARWSLESKEMILADFGHTICSWPTL